MFVARMYSVLFSIEDNVLFIFIGVDSDLFVCDVR